MTQDIVCEHCEGKFRVIYDDQVIEESLEYCVFCGGYIAEHSNDPPNLMGFVDDDDDGVDL